MQGGNLSVSHSLDSSPSRGAIGKEILFFVDCQSLSCKERWHPEGMTERLYNLSPLCYTVFIISRNCGKL